MFIFHFLFFFSFFFFFIRLAAAQVELDAVMATLKEKQDSLAAVEEKVTFGIIVIYFDGLNSKCGRSLTKRSRTTERLPQNVKEPLYHV